MKCLDRNKVARAKAVERNEVLAMYGAIILGVVGMVLTIVL